MRLYLDTADLITIADAEVDPASLAALREAVSDTGTVLVGSVAHLWDFFERSDEPTRERMIAAINSFPTVAFVMVDPTTLEAEPGASADIELAVCADIREVLDHPDTKASLRALDAVPALAREAEQAAAEAKRVAGRPMKKAHVERYLRLLIDFANPANRLDDDGVAALWKERSGLPLTGDVRTAITSMTRMIEGLRAQIPDLDEDQIVDLALGNEPRDLAQVAPGTFVQRALRDARRRNYTRNSKESDLVDLHHVPFLPYVDVMTADRENVAELDRLVGQVRRTRSARLLRSGRMGDIPAVLRALAHEKAQD